MPFKGFLCEATDEPVEPGRVSRRRSRAKIEAAIRDTYGKYAPGSSLTQALLNERVAERQREANKAAFRQPFLRTAISRDLIVFF